MTDPAVSSARPRGFRIVPGGSSSAVVMHVPHASTVIPPEVRGQLLLDDVELARELERMTDARTDELAAAAAALVVPRPWLFVNCLSCLVVDPERFPDEREEMRRVGMGAVYHRTSAGLPLRDTDGATEADLIEINPGSGFAAQSAHPVRSPVGCS